MAKKPDPTPEVPPASRGERLVAAWFVAIIGLSIAAIVALFIGGVNASGPIWDAVRLVPFIGLPATAIMIVVLFILTARRRSRAAKGAGK